MDFCSAEITSSAARDRVPKVTTLAAMESADLKSLYGAAATFDGIPIDTTHLEVREEEES